MSNTHHDCQVFPTSKHLIFQRIENYHVPTSHNYSVKYTIFLFLVAGQRLKLLLSFAVGGLLGDVFLHLLPEAWAHINPGNVFMFYL